MCLTFVMSTASSQYYQGFSINKKYMEDSCWVFINSGINASIGNNKNYVTNQLTNNASLISPWMIHNAGSTLSFPYRTTRDGDTLQVWVIYENGYSFKLKTYVCEDTFKTAKIKFPNSENCKIEWRFLSAGNDRGYIDYISVDNGYVNSDTSTCSPVVLLPIKDQTPPNVNNTPYESAVSIVGNTVKVDADEYYITVFDMSMRKVMETKNQETIISNYGLNIVYVTYFDINQGIYIRESFQMFL